MARLSALCAEAAGAAAAHAAATDRHDQLLLFLIAGERAARRALEDRLAALEARLA